MEERLDDAIWVLKSHAENPTMRGVPPLGYPAAAYPQGMTEALQVIFRGYRYQSPFKI